MKNFYLILILIINTAFINAQWTSNTSANTTICNEVGDQATPKAAMTSDGGCYIMWFDNRVPNYKVYLQRLDPAGNPLFGTNGMLVSGFAQNNFLQDFNIDVDADDNAVIVFTDTRNGTLNPFAYLVSPGGTLLWGTSGISLTDSTAVSQNIPVVRATGDGNYVFAWTYASGPNRIAMQKLDVNGNPQWGTAPMKLRGTGTENFSYARLVKSDNGSVIMSWDAWTGNFATSSSIKLFIQKFSSAGAKLWMDPQDTIQNLGRLSGISFIPYIISDGNDGAVLCWQDDRNADARASVFVQRINSNGVIQFPKNGSEGSLLSTNNHFLPTVNYIESTGETVMFWTETNGGQTVVGGLYGQKFDAAGNRQWGDNGKEFKSMDNNQLSFIQSWNKDTTVIVNYSETQFGSSNVLIKGMGTGPSGNFHWTGNIVSASTSSGSKIRKMSAFDKNSGMTVMAWSTGDIIAQNMNFDGSFGASEFNLKYGIEGFWNSPTQVQDTITCNMRESASPYNLVQTGKMYLNSNGEGSMSFTTTSGGNYFLEIRHRNALETWSANPVWMKSGISEYDFTTSQSTAYGNNIVLKGGRYCAYSGDVNQDGVIDGADGSICDNDAANFVFGYVDTDVNGDGIVDGSDSAIIDNNSANFISVEKP
ncbi:MAG: hypothetical protein HGGPFJEG_00034 [Ignavibacteria bacterium]|nr:hypothetical protein [Ignavibacteria bacterium]